MAGVPPDDALTALPRKYTRTSYNAAHIAKSLAYFEDAEAEPDPLMLAPYRWPAVKRYCLEQARAVVESFTTNG